MKRPNIEDYHQDKTFESLINGPYNRTKYSLDLEKYIDYLEAQSKLKNNGSLGDVSDSDFEKVMTELQTNFGWNNIEVLPNSYKKLLNDTINAVKKCYTQNFGNSLPYPIEILDRLKIDVEFIKGRLVIKKQ